MAGNEKNTGEAKIREMSLSDYDAVTALWRSLPGMGLSGADERGEIRKFLERNPSTSLVLLMGDRIIGTILGGFDGRRGYIYHLAVAEGEWGKGFGSMLLRELEGRFSSLGVQRVHLMIYTDNRFLPFYKKRGFFMRDELFLLSKDLQK
jgi:ribosomal protein S18 acetylase RimI-like enzyme